jgi:TonB family protein
MIRTGRRVSLISIFGSLSGLACASSGTPARSIHTLRAEPTSCVSAIGADTTVYEVAQIDEKPVFRSAMKLTFPPEALHQRIHGRVVVTAVVNAGGDVDQSSIIVAKRVHPLLDAEARRVVSTATLWPACRNGQAVRARIAVPFDFTVRNPTIGFWPLFAIGVAGGIAGALLGHAR